MFIRRTYLSKERCYELSQDKDYQVWIKKIRRIYPYFFIISILILFSIQIFAHFRIFHGPLLILLAMVSLLLFFLAVAFRRCVKEFERSKSPSAKTDTPHP